MKSKTVPQVKARAAVHRRDSDIPTFVVAGLTLASGALGGWVGGAEGAMLGGGASLIAFGGAYAGLAWLFCWPRLSWSSLLCLLYTPIR
jgi:hypothetical protein